MYRLECFASNFEMIIIKKIMNNIGKKGSRYKPALFINALYFSGNILIVINRSILFVKDDQQIFLKNL